MGDRPDRSGNFPVFLDACPFCDIAVGTSHHEMQLVVAERAIQDISDGPYIRVCRAGGPTCEVLDIYETQGP